MRGNLPGVGTLGAIGTGMVDVTWVFFVFMRNATVWQCYADGIMFDDTFGTGTPGTPVGNDRVVGAAASGLHWAHVAFFNFVLTPLEIARLWMIGARTLVTP